MGCEHHQTIDPPPPRGPFDVHLLISIFQIHQVFNILYFPQFNLPFEKKVFLSQNAQKSPKLYPKPPNRGYGYKHRDLALLEKWASYWQKGRQC